MRRRSRFENLRKRTRMTAIEELKLRLAEALASLEIGKVTADGLKDHWWQICYAMKPAIAELRQEELPSPHWTDKRKAATDGAGVASDGSR